MADKYPSHNNQNHANYHGSSTVPHQVSNRQSSRQNKPQIGTSQEHSAKPTYHSQSKHTTSGQSSHQNQGHQDGARRGHNPHNRDVPPSNPQQQYSSHTESKQSYQQHRDKPVVTSDNHPEYNKGNSKSSSQSHIVNPNLGKDTSKNYNTERKADKSFHGSMGNILPHNPTSYQKSAAQDSNYKRPQPQNYHGSVPNVNMPSNSHRNNSSSHTSNNSTDKYNKSRQVNDVPTYQNQAYMRDSNQNSREKKPDNKEQYNTDRNYRKEPKEVPPSKNSTPNSTHTNFQNKDKQMDCKRGQGHDNYGYHKNENIKGKDKSEANYARPHGPSNPNQGSSNQRQVPNNSSTGHTVSYNDPINPQHTRPPPLRDNNNYGFQNRPDQIKSPLRNEMYKSQEIKTNQPVTQYKTTHAPVAPLRSKNLSSSKPELNTQAQYQSGHQQPKNQYNPSSKPDRSNNYRIDKKVTLDQTEVNRPTQDNSIKAGSTPQHTQYKQQHGSNNQHPNADTHDRERINSDESAEKRKFEKRTTQNMSNAPSAKRRERIQSHQETGISGPIPKSYRNSNVPNQSGGFDPTPPTRTASMGALNQIGQPRSISNNPAVSMGNQSNLYRSTSVPAISATQESSQMYHRGSVINNTQNGGLYKSKSILSLAMIQADQSNLRRSASLASLVASNPNLARTASTYALYEMQVEKGIIPKDHQQTFILAIIATLIFPPLSCVLGGLCLYFTVKNKPVWKTDLPRAIHTNTRLFWSSIGVIVFSICMWVVIIILLLLHIA